MRMTIVKSLIAKTYLHYFKFFPVDRGKNFVARMLNKIFGSFELETSHGFNLQLVLYSPSEIKYFLHHEDYVQNQIKELKQGDTFVDVGANIGYYSLLAAKYVSDTGCVYSFEPSQREYTKLLTNIGINEARNVIPVNSAVGKESSLVELEMKEYHTGGNSIAHGGIGAVNSVLVTQTSLDQFISEYRINKIDLLKIDVEGFEFNVLQGLENALSKKIIEKILVEITPKFLDYFNHDVGNIYNYLKRFGFSSEFGMNDSCQYDELFTLASPD